MKPRPAPLARTPAEQAAIDALDRELATLSEAFISWVLTGGVRVSLVQIHETIAKLDALRPEWRGMQYVRPIAERQREAADNFFNTP